MSMPRDDSCSPFPVTIGRRRQAPSSATFIGRAGALAEALGIGAAVASSPGIAVADTGGSDSSSDADTEDAETKDEEITSTTARAEEEATPTGPSTSASAAEPKSKKPHGQPPVTAETARVATVSGDVSQADDEQSGPRSMQQAQNASVPPEPQAAVVHPVGVVTDTMTIISQTPPSSSAMAATMLAAAAVAGAVAAGGPGTAAPAEAASQWFAIAYSATDKQFGYARANNAQEVATAVEQLRIRRRPLCARGAIVTNGCVALAIRGIGEEYNGGKGTDRAGPWPRHSSRSMAARSRSRTACECPRRPVTQRWRSDPGQTGVASRVGSS
jgi:hypothetical protein